MSDKITIREIISNDTQVSSMRWAFFHTIRLAWTITVLTVVVLLSNPFLPEGKKFDLATLVTLNGVMYGIAFGGKAAQSFSSNDTTTSSTPKE